MKKLNWKYRITYDVNGVEANWGWAETMDEVKNMLLDAIDQGIEEVKIYMKK